MFLLHIQAEMVPVANISHKPMPSTFSAGCFSYTSSMKWCLQELLPQTEPNMLYTGCFSYTSRLKWCPQDLLPQTSAQYAIYKMFLLHIQAEMVPIANISHKPMPTTLSMGCFSSTSRLKWCLQELLPQSSAQYALYRMFLLHVQA